MLNHFLKLFLILYTVLSASNFVSGSWIQRGAGLVVYRKVNDTAQYLILQTSAASVARNNWVFVHVRLTSGEEETGACLRALEKKTGIRQDDVKIVPDFKRQIKITVNQRGVIRKVNYFIAELLNPDVQLKLSMYYHDYKWAPLLKAQSLLVFPDQQKLIGHIHEFLENGAPAQPPNEAKEDADYTDSEMELDAASP